MCCAWLIFSVTTNGIKDLYDLGLNKTSGTMSLWINKKLGSGTEIIANEETAKQIINLVKLNRSPNVVNLRHM